MVTRLRSLGAATLLTCAVAASASGQDPQAPASTSAPANLSYVEGAVDVVLEGVTERASPPMLLLEGDVVRTRNGRAEVVFGDGTLLHLTSDGELEVLGPEHLRLLSGRLVLRLSHAAARPYLIDTPSSTVRMDAQGEYDITATRGGRLELAVARGNATIGETLGRLTVRTGQMVSVLPGERPVIQPYNSARLDAFAEWAYERTNGFASAQSAHQLPYELRPYAPLLDQHGRWDYVAPHGYVWFPSVSAAWRPYYEGSWSFTRYGWTWYGQDSWAWPTHHYGRWGFNGAFWYWVPATVWGPAWVSWGFAPGYVSWAPLGWDGRPAIHLFDRRDHPAYAPNYNPWRGWTVLPRDHFRPRGNVRAHAIDGERLDEATQRAMAVQNTTVPPSRAVARDRGTPPDTRGSAVTRDSVAMPGVGGGNVRRPPSGAAGASDSPVYAPASPGPIPPSNPTSPSYGRRRSAAGAAAAGPAPTAETAPASGAPAPRTAPRADSPEAVRPGGAIERGGALERGSRRRAPSASSGAPDAPAYAPRSVPSAPAAGALDSPSSPSYGRRRGGGAPVSYPPAPADTAAAPTGAVRRSDPRAQSPQPSQAGAGEQPGASRRAPSAGTPSSDGASGRAPSTATPPGASPPASAAPPSGNEPRPSGGARRRPPPA